MRHFKMFYLIAAMFLIFVCYGIEGVFLSNNMRVEANDRPSEKASDSTSILKIKVERTLSIIKPDAVRENVTGDIISRLEKAGLKIIAQRRLRLTREQAERFYSVHREKPFFNTLCDFMCSGPIVVQVLSGENAVKKNREVMGPTNPLSAAPGTIRHDFGKSIETNAVHGSDSVENANIEIAFFFGEVEIIP